MRLFDAVGLIFVQFEPGKGILFRRSPDEHDTRVLKSFGRRRMIWSDSEDALHVLRIVCRARAISAAASSRNDVEGVELVDLEASSSKVWRSFCASLSKHQRLLLEVFRCGATSTATRRFFRRDFSKCAHCHLCGAAIPPSLRHFWVECSAFADSRKAAQRAYNIQASWWAQQPRITSKSGWITYQASPNPQRRAVLQVAACRLGIVVLEGIRDSEYH